MIFPSALPTDLTTPHPVSEHPQTSNTTREHTRMMSTKASITGKTQTTMKKCKRERTAWIRITACASL